MGLLVRFKGDDVYIQPNVNAIHQTSGKIFVISGPSGVGKGTLIRAAKQDSDLKDQVVDVPSYTTREPRPGELSGKQERVFVSRDQFDRMRTEGQLFEAASFDGHRYGLALEDILNVLNRGKNILLEVTAKTALQLKDLYPNTVRTVFIAPPSPALETLRKRLGKRGTNTEESINHRLEQAKGELKLRSRFGYEIVAEEVSSSLEKLKSFILGARNKSIPPAA